MAKSFNPKYEKWYGRKLYRKAKSFDSSCRNHGSCSYCMEGRLRYKKIIEVIEKEQEQELI